MLLANLCIQSNLHEDALAYVLRAEAIAKEKKDYEWQVRTSGFLSTIFRDANLIAKARKKLTSSIDYDLIQINLHHEKGHLEFKDDNYRRSVEEFQSAQKYIPLLAERLQDGYLSNNYLILGENYLKLKDYDKSAEYLSTLLFQYSCL
jgi:tetratricopeptide (TPR) repeat protein